MEEAVYWSREGSIATITLNRPAQFNVMNHELSAGLRTALMECWDDDEVRAVILTGNGKAFSGGGDIKFFVEALAQQRIIPSLEKMMPVLHAAIATVREIPKPVIAALNGVAAGGGFGLALACDFRIASPQVNLVTAFLGIGASPDSSSTFFLPRYVGLAKATEMFLRNKPVPAEEALNLGLLTALVEPNQVMAEAKKLAEELPRVRPPRLDGPNCCSIKALAAPYTNNCTAKPAQSPCRWGHRISRRELPPLSRNAKPASQASNSAFGEQYAGYYHCSAGRPGRSQVGRRP